MNKIILLISLSLCQNLLFGQKMLLLEKYGRARTTKLFEGDDLTYRLKNDPDNTWLNDPIVEILIEEKALLLGIQKVNLADIEAIRIRRNGLMRSIGTQLMVFGATWMGFATVGQVFYNDPITRKDPIISASAVAMGWTLRKTLRYKKIKMGTRRRLRVVDITMKKL